MVHPITRSYLQHCVDDGSEPLSMTPGSAQYIRTPGGNTVLQNTNGSLTAAGDYYWLTRGLDPPLLYPFGQSLMSDGNVHGHGGQHVKVLHESGGVTEEGLPYFRFHRPTITVRVGIIRYRRHDSRMFRVPRQLVFRVAGVIQTDGKWRRTTQDEWHADAISQAIARIGEKDSWTDLAGNYIDEWDNVQPCVVNTITPEIHALLSR